MIFPANFGKLYVKKEVIPACMEKVELIVLIFIMNFVARFTL